MVSYLDASTGHADGPAGTDAALDFPIGVAYVPTGTDTQGTAYVSAVYENQIRRLTIGDNDIL